MVMMAASSHAAASDDPLSTNEMWAVSPPLTFEFDDTVTSTDWKVRFSRELIKNQPVVFDRLGPPAGYELTRQSQIRRYGMFSELSSRATGAFARALQDSAQETALAIFPVDEWLEILPLEKWQNAAERLFTGSLGNTTEQELGNLTPAYSASESWWRRGEHDSTLRYGIRPRTAPYGYIASEIGHFDGRPALAIDARLRYLPVNRIQATFQATVALPNAFELTFSALSEPLRASHTTSAAVRLQRVIGDGPTASVFFLGFLHTSSETAVVVGASRAW
jgi:hypothetical protein